MVLVVVLVLIVLLVEQVVMLKVNHSQEHMEIVLVVMDGDMMEATVFHQA